MASIIYSPKDIFEQEFKTSMRGYDKKEIDEFLDNVIQDYESYLTQIQELSEENDRLKQQLAAKSKADAQSSYASSQAASAQQTRVAQSATNFDILKRISRLEKEVFGKQING